MQFPLNIFVAVVISAIHVLVCFALRLPSKYKKQFRIYSVAVNLIFIVFLLGFSIFFKTSLPTQGINIYYNGLATFVCGKINVHTFAAQKYITPQAACKIKSHCGRPEIPLKL